ncbi:hypothetical protein HPB48_008156 [Haemaphysalis longicornis]|uniref:CCR4-NOT transcription complex subunit 9 n=1 Tax=Haemaphysalis longicornis TaxID=44386 RepID=A0A9J6FEV6_HAELO|nr:hypothetical protein HPB48_008156 [Haemaphysalis longicornis]
MKLWSYDAVKVPLMHLHKLKADEGTFPYGPSLPTPAPSYRRGQFKWFSQVPMNAPPQHSNAQPAERDKIVQWVKEIADPNTRANALLELRHTEPQKAELPTPAHQSNRVCNALALMQCAASHPEIRPSLIAANIPMYLYPFLQTVSKNRPFEFLRLTSLGVLGALVKSDEPAVISFLLTTEIIPLCLRVMESGCDLSKTVTLHAHAHLTIRVSSRWPAPADQLRDSAPAPLAAVDCARRAESNAASARSRHSPILLPREGPFYDTERMRTLL